MFLSTLKIQDGSKVIREIRFRKGINLIVDETSILNRTASGNSVGKTTVIRLIDFCLGGKGENIYRDPEFKGTNERVEEYLKQNNVIINLILIEDFDDDSSFSIVISRNFLSRTKKIQTINGVQYSEKDFSRKLMELIFKTNVDTPTFKQMISKNIRDEKNKIDNTLRVLAPNVVTEPTYEALHLFWFGITAKGDKDKLTRDKNAETRLQERLSKLGGLSEIARSLDVINKEIVELSKKKDSLGINDKYEADLMNLDQIKAEANRLSATLSRIQLRKELILESKIDLEKSFADINPDAIAKMYERAKVFIPSLQKSFQEALNFHNEMISKRAAFIVEELPELERLIIESKAKLSRLLSEEKKIVESLAKSGTIEELQLVITQLNFFHERKGNLEERKAILEQSKTTLDGIKHALSTINESIASKDKLIQERISQFNEFFNDFSRRLDDVISLLSADSSDGTYRFKIANVVGNPGTGSKKSQMAAFDLAYIKFADSLGIPCLHFILQDQIENVHSNQISNLLTEIVGEVNCQYVLPVLRDKLPPDIDIQEFEILSLSQNDKLFRILT